MLAALAGWFSRSTVVLWIAYFGLLEIISFGTRFGPSCFFDINGSDAEGEQYDQQYCPTLHVGLVRLTGYFVDLVDSRHDAFTAGATIVIAIFTFTLWRATSRVWEAGEKQISVAKQAADAAKQAADALPVVERAYVYPMIISAGGTGECIREALVFYDGDFTKDDTPIPTTAEITFKIKNYGKTPAILKTAYAGFGINPIGTELGLSIPEAILGEMETTSELTSKMLAGPTRNQAQNIMVYTASMGFSGQITFDDIWGKEHTTRFLFVWDKEIQRMALRQVETTTKSD
jgi:hypothetical protein